MAKVPNALVYLGPQVSRPRSAKEREDLIQRAAYYKALQRNFAPGHELEDWLAAEREVDMWLQDQDGG